MRTHLIVWAAVIGLAVGASVVVQAKDPVPPVTVTIKGCQDKQPPVTFAHRKHSKELKIACTKCHHKGAGTKCTDAKCHASNDGKAEGKRPGCKEMSPTKNPFHIRCVGCHKSEGKGPKTCKECHKK